MPLIRPVRPLPGRLRRVDRRPPANSLSLTGVEKDDLRRGSACRDRSQAGKPVKGPCRESQGEGRVQPERKGERTGSRRRGGTARGRSADFGQKQARESGKRALHRTWRERGRSVVVREGRRLRSLGREDDVGARQGGDSVCHVHQGRRSVSDDETQRRKRSKAHRSHHTAE